MINKIIDFSLRNKLIIGLLTLALIGWGIYNFTRLSIDAVPDITDNQVQVITVTPSLAPQEVEQFITFPVETSMANIQDVKEIRSISRFGLSVVTIVFEDRLDPYLARQLVSEQIKVAEGEIPDGYGKPEMMPITTGLGEIYQYVIEPEPGYEHLYDPMRIRTIQDWIIKRQLSGIPGIVEISSFGGFIKQYEVSIKPRTLVGMDLTITEIFNALEQNNQNSGGSYIEKGADVFYIRAEGLVKDIEDIRNIVVKNIDGVPLLIRDVADVRISAPPRFGAMTKDGKGEAVGGITLMLKGANTSQVIREVKKRMELVRKSLPEGLAIHAYLDRSELISKTINTVSKNLIEGGLIVIFVLILLLGNYRAGLIVASVIPLSMMFAFSMMNIFGVSANLMSLGAIDFGLIVDGSVIIVEGIIYQVHKSGLKGRFTRQELDANISMAGNRVSKSAVFGVIIILIVYLPILAFTGIEGKMFRPMAQTVSFALLGALILSLTYVPVMASLTLRNEKLLKANFADRIVAFLEKSHQPVLKFALRYRMTFMIIVILLVAISIWKFTRMGGEFIPTLEEGDLAAQMTLQPGSSLSQSIATSTRAEKILLDNFPEVVEVVSKIGTAEVPTDPMAVEDADIMIVMKPKSEWVSAGNRDEMSEKMKEALAVLPGVSFEFTQPIQLRFNELMTGVKADVAVKIYGDDLDLLYEKANEAAAMINDIEGAGDVRVEQIVGLPQLVISYKRDRLARNGLNIEDINRIIRTAFAGETAGTVFEGEKRFDLVVRLCEECRNSIQSIQNLRVNNPAEELIVLSQVADISIREGPMQISRDNASRRITIGINVRNRDVESFITEVNDRLESGFDLPAGYYITYGGQFENLREARKSSSIAVPIALAVILILLYFAFYSLKHALMIFTAIPLAAVGGIWALVIRGMPFSISAGVGFIALFGVAVLNGIVLISYYQQLKKEGMSGLLERVIIGTRARLRPVLMTASVAALGFVPMALSTAAGAEVQKPLATVVIGGIITSTFLTLVFLPLIYVMFDEGLKLRGRKTGKTLLVVLPLLFTGIAGHSQAQGEVKAISVNEAVTMALEQNYQLGNARLDIEKAAQMKKTSFNLPPPELYLELGQINSSLHDRYFSVSQSFDFPTTYTSRARLNKAMTGLEEERYAMTQSEVVARVMSVYSHWVMYHEQLKEVVAIDSIYKDFMAAAALRFSAGDINELEMVVAESEAASIMNTYQRVQADLMISENELRVLMNAEKAIRPSGDQMIKLELMAGKDTTGLENNPFVAYVMQYRKVQDAVMKNEGAQYLPNFSIGYFNQSIDKVNGFEGVQLGMSFPLWFWSRSGVVKAARIEREKADNQLEAELIKATSEIENQFLQLEKYGHMLRYYEDKALMQADMMLEHSLRAFSAGNISYVEYANAASGAFDIRMEYLETMNNYNQTIIRLDYLLGSYQK
jgi:cobalt-zinc-cadmium resistance protein CzcA